jgi:CHAD domain-containing protein
MARAREVPDLACDEPFALAAARVIAVRGAEVIEHSRDVLDMADIERVHDMRVATRQLRAAMEIFAPCFPRKRLRATLKEVKAIADALGERRDRDVAIADLSMFIEQVGPEDREGLGALIETLRAEQALANERLVDFVAPQRLRNLKARLEELVDEAEASVAAAGPRR